MLFDPEFDQTVGRPPAEGERAMDAGVAGRAERDEGSRIVNSGLAVVDV